MIEKLTKENLQVGRFIQFMDVKFLVVFGKISAVYSTLITVSRDSVVHEVLTVEELVRRHALVMDDLELVRRANKLAVAARVFLEIASR